MNAGGGLDVGIALTPDRAGALPTLCHRSMPKEGR
jgi:hypothetical protein